MKLTITHTSARSLALVMATTRIFFGAAIDLPGLYTGAWISVLLGGLMATPLFAWIGAYAKRHHHAQIIDSLQCETGRVWIFVLLLLFLPNMCLDTSAISNVIVLFSGYIALSDTPLPYLFIPLLLTVWWCIRKNGLAIGSLARVWTLAAAWIGGVIFLMECRLVRLHYLFPIFGAGRMEIFRGGLYIAGWLMPTAVLWLLAEPDVEKTNRGFKPLQTMWISCAVAIALLLFSSMLAPSLVFGENTRLYKLDQMISNGRTALSAQMPTIALWLNSLLHNLVGNAFISALLIQKMLPALPGWLCALIVLLICAALFLAGLTDRTAAAINGAVQFAVVHTALGLSIGVSFLKGRWKKHETA